ncbi:MAG: S9 family peptidase [Opitutaceae bacterium]|nr:S9 family peptidase [Opitutaceae bacterium]
MSRLAPSLPLLCTLVFGTPAFGSEPVITPNENLVVEGIPAIPASLASDLKRYTEARSAGFAGWHPTNLEMLVSTRFANTNQLHWVRQPLGMRKQVTFYDEPVSSAGFDPIDGAFFLFLKDQGGSEFSQLYRFDLADEKATLLSDGGRSQNGGVAWSNRGDRIAYGSTRRNGADRDIYVMNPREPKGERLVLENKGGGWGVADWSPDDSQLLVVERISVNESHLYLLSLADGSKEAVFPRTQTGVAFGDAVFSKDGKGLFVTTDRDSEFKRLAYVDLGSRKTTYLSTSLQADVEAISLSDDGRRLALEVNDHGVSRIYLMDTVTRVMTPVGSLPPAVIGITSWHKNNRHLGLVINSAMSPSDVHVLDADTGSVTRWTESELGGIPSASLREAELVSWKSFDGLEVTGFLYRPAPKFTGKRPVIINIHGGPESQSLPIFQGRSNYYLNELGVAILYPNVRGSTGFGKTFVTLDNGYKREDSVKDIGALLDWVATQPDLDANRVMITGGSYGGYMTLACAIAYNERIRCSLAVVGISNFVTFLEATESYRRDLRRVEYGDERDPAMREFLIRISPTTRAAKISKPLFIVQGRNDPRVPRGEAIQMVETVRKNGSPVWYLEAKDEGHGFRKKINADFQFYATIRFVQEHLLAP